MLPVKLDKIDLEIEEDLLHENIICKLFLVACAPGQPFSEKLHRAATRFIEQHRDNTAIYQKSISTVH